MSVQLSDLLYLARLGCKVFPLSVGSKHPQPGSHGHKDATADPAIIKNWFAKYPKANWAFVPGPLLAVLDLDVKKGKNGLAFFAQWCKAHGLAYLTYINAGVVINTCSGGTQILFTTSKSLRQGV